jgi:hypothetical protein
VKFVGVDEPHAAFLDESRTHWLRPKVLPLAPSTAHSHHLWSLESETWDDPEKLYAHVNSFLQSHIVE